MHNRYEARVPAELRCRRGETSTSRVAFAGRDVPDSKGSAYVDLYEPMDHRSPPISERRQTVALNYATPASGRLCPARRSARSEASQGGGAAFAFREREWSHRFAKGVNNIAAWPACGCTSRRCRTSASYFFSWSEQRLCGQRSVAATQGEWPSRINTAPLTAGGAHFSPAGAQSVKQSKKNARFFFRGGWGRTAKAGISVTLNTSYVANRSEARAHVRRAVGAPRAAPTSGATLSTLRRVGARAAHAVSCATLHRIVRVEFDWPSRNRSPLAVSIPRIAPAPPLWLRGAHSSRGPLSPRPPVDGCTPTPLCPSRAAMSVAQPLSPRRPSSPPDAATPTYPAHRLPRATTERTSAPSIPSPVRTGKKTFDYFS